MSAKRPNKKRLRKMLLYIEYVLFCLKRDFDLLPERTEDVNSHLDSDSPVRSAIAKQFMDELEQRAEKIRSMERSKITGGADGEPILAEWSHEGVHVRQLPDDPQGILRISVGGGKHLPVSVNYCVFRGDRSACIDQLRRALKAIESDPA